MGGADGAALDIVGGMCTLNWIPSAPFFFFLIKFFPPQEHFKGPLSFLSLTNM